MENGLKQPRGPPGKTNAGTLLNYYKPIGVDSRPTQPQHRENDLMDGVVESNRDTHLTQSPDGSISCDVERKNPEPTPSRPRMAPTNTMHNLDPDESIREPTPLVTNESVDNNKLPLLAQLGADCWDPMRSRMKQELAHPRSLTPDPPLCWTDGGGPESRSKPEQEPVHPESLPPHSAPGWSSSMVGSPTQKTPSDQDFESLLTPSPDQNSRIRIIKGGLMAPNTGGLPASVPALQLDRNTG